MQARARAEQQHERKEEQCSSATDSKNRAAARARAEQLQTSAIVEVAAEEATTWGRDAVDDVAGDRTVDGEAMSARYRAPAAP